MRKHYIDNTRSLTILLVILYHVLYIFSPFTPGSIEPITDVRLQDSFSYFVYPWFMAILFLIAGMSAKWYLEEHTEKEFCVSRTRKLLVPSTLGILFFGWLQGAISMKIGHAFESMPINEIPKFVTFLIMALSGTGILWFCQLLWLFSMMLLLIRKLEKNKLCFLLEDIKLPWILLLVIPAALSGKLLNTPIVVVYRFGLYGFYFFLGYFLFSSEKNMEKLPSVFYPLFGLSLLLGTLETTLYYGSNYAVEPVSSSLLNGVYAYVASLAILGGMQRYCDKETPFFHFLKERSWKLYLFHYLPLSAVALVLARKTKLPAFLIYLLTFVSAVGGALLLGEVISHIPLVRWLLMGIKKEKHHVQ